LGRAQADQYDQAKEGFDEALRLVPDFPMMQLEYAHAAMRSGDFEHASALAKDLLQKYPKNTKVQAEAHVLLGQSLMKADNNSEAKLQFEAAVFLDASFSNGYELAVADLNLGDIEAARKIFTEMLSSFGDTAALHLYFGQAYGNSDFQSDAVVEFRKALAKDSHFRGVHYSLAVAYLASAGDSKLPEALAALRDEISISPGDSPAYAALGHLLATHGQGVKDQAQADSYLKKATELDPNNPDSFLYMGQFYADQKRLPEAESALARSIALTSDVSRNAFQVQKAHYLLARLLVQSGDKAGADREFATSQALLKQNLSHDQGRLSKYLGEAGQADKAVELNQPLQATNGERTNDNKSREAVEAFETRMKPAVADSYNNLGAIAASTDHYEAAARYFQSAYAWQPSIPGLDFNWGRAAFAAGNYAEALAPLTRYLQSHPDDDGARRVLGLSQFLTRDYIGTRTTLAKLANATSEQPKVQFAYADSLLKTGDALLAIRRLETLQKSSPDLVEVPPALAEAYASIGRQQLAQGDPKSAVANLQKAIKLDPGNSELQRSLDQATRKASQD
jgi:tetratricopeptide (TPR) repeat protein